MRVFVSSSFEDLREHRAAAIRVLRQLGHDVVAMEDMTAGSAAPLFKVLEMVDRCEAYVGVFAWRYGYTPTTSDPPPPGRPAVPAVPGAVPGQTSITHYEYLRAVERKLPVLAFLLDETYPWPPRLVDGFDPATTTAQNTTSIRALRAALQQERVVSWFTTPSDLEARVSAAITMAGLTRQLDLQPATALDPLAGVAGDSSAEAGITNSIKSAGDHQRAVKIDLRSTWWSTRLYLIASLAERLTQVRRILIVDSTPRPAIVPATGSTGPQAGAPDNESFVGQLSTTSIIATIGPTMPALQEFARRLHDRPSTFNVLEREIHELLDQWRDGFGDPPGTHSNEEAAKVDLSPTLLRRWFGEAMLSEPVRIADLQRASVVDLLRLLDYPCDFVPVVTHRQPSGGTVSERVDVMDKAALNARLAKSYLVELMDRARIS
jgi:Domain of unknown function (DUF4062)